MQVSFQMPIDARTPSPRRQSLYSRTPPLMLRSSPKGSLLISTAAAAVSSLTTYGSSNPSSASCIAAGAVVCESISAHLNLCLSTFLSLAWLLQSAYQTKAGSNHMLGCAAITGELGPKASAQSTMSVRFIMFCSPFFRYKFLGSVQRGLCV